tara:strand:- start:521 stop:742 length:222 start_codon:yes stop_codon:yes gene_type:complete
MERKSNTVFKMAGYKFPGASPMTKKAGPEGKKVDIDDLIEEDDDMLPVYGTKGKVRRASRKARKAAKKFAKDN